MEEVLVRAIVGHAREPEFRDERDRIYEHEDLEHRDAAFQELHARWFGALGLDAPLVQALEEQAVLARETRLCRIVSAKARSKEGADLYVNPDSSVAEPRGRRAILIRLAPMRFLDPQALLELLRHELLHVADMLDPAFGYEPSLKCSGSDPSLQTLIRNRYRSLWNATVDGRLWRLGQATERVRERCLTDFLNVFPIPAEAAKVAFSSWFDTPVHTHAELVAFAHNPGTGSTRCPLCRAPAYGLESPQLEPAIVDAIRRDFARWTPDSGLCRQCADLYGSRAGVRRDRTWHARRQGRAM
jgi:hypothetical protein